MSKGNDYCGMCEEHHDDCRCDGLWNPNNIRDLKHMSGITDINLLELIKLQDEKDSQTAEKITNPAKPVDQFAHIRPLCHDNCDCIY